MDKKKEAVKRMKKWGIFPQTIKDFEKEDLVSVSEPPFGACFWVNEDQKKRIKEFEEENNALVYHVIRSFTTFGELENYLYVSNYPEEWEMDNSDILENQQLCYVNNLTDPMFSELGTIGIEITPAAGLRRTW